MLSRLREVEERPVLHIGDRVVTAGSFDWPAIPELCAGLTGTVRGFDAIFDMKLVFIRLDVPLFMRYYSVENPLGSWSNDISLAPDEIELLDQPGRVPVIMHRIREQTWRKRNR